MNKLRRFFTAFELPLFFLLAYALSWWSVPFANGGMFPYGPSIAAVIVLALTSGKRGLRVFWNRFTNWRVGWWLIAGPAILVGNLLAAWGINLLLGATMTNSPHLPPMSTLLGLLLLGGVWEEPGWAGYAFPRMRERVAFRKYPDLQATLLLGMLWGVWHLPLYLYGTLPWYDIFIVVALRVVYSWISNQSGESVPAAMATHYASNVLAGSTMFLVFTGSEKDTYYILYVICTCITALGIAWLSRFRLGRAGPEFLQQELQLNSR